MCEYCYAKVMAAESNNGDPYWEGATALLNYGLNRSDVDDVGGTSGVHSYAPVNARRQATDILEAAYTLVSLKSSYDSGPAMVVSFRSSVLDVDAFLPSVGGVSAYIDWGNVDVDIRDGA